VLFASYAPYGLIFPGAAAIVHSGGIGTTAQALKAGKPQIIMPFSHDQPDNGDRVRRLGVGNTITRKRYIPDRVAAQLCGLLSNAAVAVRAAEIGSQIASEDGSSTAAGVLERIGAKLPPSTS
jgi:UDP:flavonoid glycosyltransferase YjiC (YdhE family)